MKRFALFMAEEYEASGGWDDFIGSYDNIDSIPWEIVQKHTWIIPRNLNQKLWYHIVDLSSGDIVEIGTKRYSDIKILPGLSCHHCGNRGSMIK